MDAEIREKARCVLKLCGVYPRRQKSRENWVMLISKGGKAKRCFQDKDLDEPEVNNYVTPPRSPSGRTSKEVVLPRRNQIFIDMKKYNN